MRIDELFDKPLEIHWEWESGYNPIAYFDIGNVRYHVNFIRDTHKDSEDNIQWAVTFGLELNVSGHKREKKLNSFLVFSTVLKAIDEFFEKENPEKLLFSASNDELEKLYRKMMVYFNSKGNYHIEQLFSPDLGEYYEITKMKIIEDKDTLELPDIKVGDEVKIGRFKNRKATVKGFKKDKHNHPVLKTTKGDSQLFKPRISKLQTNEAFDQPLPLKWVSSPGNTWKTAEFKINKFRIIVDFSKKTEDIWAVTFGSPETILGRSAKANVGPKTVLIFSTVLKAIDEFFERETPEKLVFSASTDALEKLYIKMIRYINSKGKYHAVLVPDFPGARETFHYEITKR